MNSGIFSYQELISMFIQSVRSFVRSSTAYHSTIHYYLIPTNYNLQLDSLNLSYYFYLLPAHIIVILFIFFSLPLLKSPLVFFFNMNENNVFGKSFKTYLSDTDSSSTHSSCECNDVNSNV